ncbi:MAG TPA: S8 family serine peptidase, partial [Pyrinomonadaceae bacterium]
FSASDKIETFSSDGPRQVFYNGDGTPKTPGNVSSTGGSILQQPAITAADGASVTGVGGFPTLFYGTSAAAPHAAAIAALIKSANPALTPAQIRTALISTAIDIEAPGVDRDSGAGIVMPYLALQSLGPPVAGKAFLDLSTVTKTETCCNGDGFIEPGETGTLTVNLKNLGLLDATSGTATLTTSTSGVTIVNGASNYPTLPASNGSAVNITPFSLSLSSSMPHNPRADFTLTINYLGGHQPSQSWNFSVGFGVEFVENGSFESGDFSGWNVSTASTGGEGEPYVPWTVSQAGAGGFQFYGILPTEPQDGNFVAWHAFAGSGPMEFRMYQDVQIPAGRMLNLTWKDRVQWNFCCGATQPNTLDVQLRNPATNEVLTTLFTFSTGVGRSAGTSAHRIGWQSHGYDLSAYAGQTVRIFFLQTVSEFFTGPGQMEFDEISLSNGPLPTPTPTPTPASPGLYAGTGRAELLKLDLTTGVGTQIGILPGFGSAEIEFNNNTRLGYTQFAPGFVAGQEFDLTDSLGIGDLRSTSGTFEGLEWVGPLLYGTMSIGFEGPAELRTLDPATGISTIIGPTGLDRPIAGLAYDEPTATMYGLTAGGFNLGP